MSIDLWGDRDFSDPAPPDPGSDRKLLIQLLITVAVLAAFVAFVLWIAYANDDSLAYEIKLIVREIFRALT